MAHVDGQVTSDAVHCSVSNITWQRRSWRSRHVRSHLHINNNNHLQSASDSTTTSP